MALKNFDELVEAVKGKTNRIVVPGANNEEVLTACKMGREKDIIYPYRIAQLLTFFSLAIREESFFNPGLCFGIFTECNQFRVYWQKHF